MSSHPYLTRSGKRGIYNYRRSVPRELRPLLGKREIVRTLGTADREAAMPAYYRVAAEVEQLFSDARQQLATSETETGAEPARHINLEAITPYCRAFVREQEEAFRRDTTKLVAANQEAFWRGEILALPLSPEELKQRRHAPLRREAPWYVLALAFRQRLSARLAGAYSLLTVGDVHGDGRVVCCSQCDPKVRELVLNAEMSALREMLAEDDARRAGLGEDPFNPLATKVRQSPPPAEQTGSPTAVPVTKLSVALQAWIESQKATWSEEQQHLCRRVVEDFIATRGDRPLNSYRKADAREFVQLLRRLPANLEKHIASLGVATRDLRKIAADHQQKDCHPAAILRLACSSLR